MLKYIKKHYILMKTKELTLLPEFTKVTPIKDGWKLKYRTKNKRWKTLKGIYEITEYNKEEDTLTFKEVV